MKKVFLKAILLILTASPVFGQSKKDSIEVSIDTINVKGKVIDELGSPIYDALVFSENLDKNHRYIQTKTSKEGLFTLNGITPKNTIRIRTGEAAREQSLGGSRYLLITLPSLTKTNTISDKYRLDITAKRVSVKQKYAYRLKDTIMYRVFHPFGHYWPANYPGGLYKFYDFVKKNIVYPEKAIFNNVEGTVVIEFTIDNTGNLKDFLIVRDIGYGCAEEVIRVIKTSKRWNSAMNGTPINQRTSIEVPFKLTD